MKILIIDDNPVDVELCLMALRRGGIAVKAEAAADEPELRALLATFAPDVVLCDFSFPNFDGFSAQQMVHDAYPEAPLIFVSGTISEEGAAMALQGGAVDYVMKSSLARLPNAVERAALSGRLAADSAEAARRHTERLETLWDIVNDPALRGQKFISAMLREAAASISPPLVFRGVLGRIDGDEVFPIALSVDADDDPHFAHLQVGRRVAVRETVAARVGRSEGWRDLATEQDLSAPLAALGWRAVISQQFDARGSRYSLTLASVQPKLFDFSKEDFAYLDAIAASLANQIQVSSLQESLRDEEERARAPAQRLEALWRIANDPALRGQEFFSAMLHEAETSLSPPLLFRGYLGRIDGDTAIITAVGSEPSAGPFEHLKVGRVAPLHATIIPRVGRSEGWRDLTAIEDLAPSLHAWRAVISGQFDADGARYSLTFISAEPKVTDFSKEDFAYLDVISAALANHIRVDSLQESIGDQEERSRHHAQRLESLWKIANDAKLSDTNKWLAMLGQAAASIKPGHSYRGVLWRVDGEDLIVEGIAETEGHMLADPPFEVGTIMPLEASVVGKVLAEGGGTRSWSNYESRLYTTEPHKSMGVRSFVLTTFTAGSRTWALSFASAVETPKPLGPLENAYIEVVASFFANNVQQRMQFERIEYQAAHDALTGLLNRSQFASLGRSKARSQSRFAIIAVDINAFHEVNETYGHTTGDALLVEVGNALQACTFSDELVGRIGPDVFGIYLGEPASKDYVRERSREFANVFTRSFSTGERERKKYVARSASIGVACAPEDGATFDAILSRADAALGAAKERGHGVTMPYEAGMERDAPRRAALRNELMAAVADDQFTLFYQPHVELKTGRVSGCEALIRWNHPERGLVLPGDFIPFAEQAGIIPAIDAWVMRNAFAAAGELSALRPGFRLYFNLSGRQAGDPKLVRTFINAARIGVDLDGIGVEITETDAMRDVEATRRVFRALRRLNVRIAIDDFGTGYSSLSSLKQLPVDIVKIDRSFISGVTNDAHDAAIAETIVSIAKRFGFESLGEGAEQPDQVDWLRDHDCRYVQGYAVCYPLPLGAFKTWLAAREGLSKAS